MGGDINSFWTSGWDEYHALLEAWNIKNGNTKEARNEFTHNELDQMYASIGKKLNGS